MKFNKFLSLTMALLLSLTAVFSVSADYIPHIKGIKRLSMKPEEIIILHTNDVHGAVDRYSLAASLKQQYQDDGAYVLLLDAGDFIQGAPAVNISQGKTAVELMNMSCYDACALGNHEFDYGYDNLKNLEDQAQFPFLGSNVLYNGEPAFEENVIFTTDRGTKIGVFGISTPETATKAHPAKIEGVSFLGESGNAMFECAQNQADYLRRKGCDLVICLSHLGIDSESEGRRSVDLLEKVSGIDLLIDGHSHSTLEDIEKITGNGLVNDTYITSAGKNIKNIGRVTIVDKEIKNIENISTEDSGIKPADGVKARADEILGEIDKEYGKKFAVSLAELDGIKKNVRTGETNLGDLITDAMVWGCIENGLITDGAVTNGGGIRASIKKGRITKGNINEVLPFGNTLNIIEIKGSMLLEALEASTFCTPEAVGGFPQVSGIEFTVDTTKPYDAGENYPGSVYARPASINRVTIESVGGKPFDPDEIYTIATNDFLAAGGDTYYAFKTAEVNYDFGLALDEVVMEYIKEVLDGRISKNDYGVPDKRIHEITD